MGIPAGTKKQPDANGDSTMNTTTSLPAIALAALPFVAACAPNPASIAAVPMGAGAYSGLTCQDSVNTLNVERANLAALEARQRGAATGDVFSVLLIGVPTSGLTGSNVAGEIAASKGKVLSLETRVAGC